MKRVLMSVYAACALCVILGSLVWFALALYSDSRTGKAEALKCFKSFAQNAGEILSKAHKESNPNRFAPQLERLCYNYQTYVQAMLIRNADGIVFIWPKNTDIFSYDGKDSVEVKNLPYFFTAARMEIPLGNTGTIATVHTALQTLPIRAVLKRGQIVFFLLLFIVLMTIAVLIFSYGTEKDTERTAEKRSRREARNAAQKTYGAAEPPTKKAPETSPADSEPEKPRNTEARLRREERKAASSTLTDQLESLNRLHIYDNDTPGSGQSAQESAGHQQNDDSANKAVSDVRDEAKEETRSNHLTQTDIVSYGAFENHNQPIEAEPEDLPEMGDSNTGYNEYRSLEQATLMEELATAITETAATEEDLALLLIRASGITDNQHIIHLLRTSLDHTHKLFVFNKDVLGLIIFYAPLDQAMQLASRLYDEMWSVLHDSIKKSLKIGLTTRAGRLVPASRMVEEATAAVGKATEEEHDPIVAFRVNPDKYRKYLAD